MEAAGVSRSEILQWMSAPFHGYTARDVLEMALHWQASGMPLATNIEWAQTGIFDPKDALRWHLAGFDAAQAVFISELVPLGQQRLSFHQCLARETGWRTCGLPPRWVCLCVALDVSIAEAHLLYARAEAERDLEGLLSMYAYMRGADPRALTIDLRQLLGIPEGK